MKFILLFLALYSFSAFSHSMPPYDPQVHIGGINPACAIAMQAGMTGQRRAAPNSIASIEKDKKHIDKRIKDIDKDLYGKSDGLLNDWIQLISRESIDCRSNNDSTCKGDKRLYFDKKQVDANKNVLGMTVQERVIKHLHGKLKNRNTNCFRGISYKEDSLNPLDILLSILPQKAYATDLSCSRKR